MNGVQELRSGLRHASQETAAYSYIRFVTPCRLRFRSQLRGHRPGRLRTFFDLSHLRKSIPKRPRLCGFLRLKNPHERKWLTTRLSGVMSLSMTIPLVCCLAMAHRSPLGRRSKPGGPEAPNSKQSCPQTVEFSSPVGLGTAQPLVSEQPPVGMGMATALVPDRWASWSPVVKASPGLPS